MYLYNELISLTDLGLIFGKRTNESKEVEFATTAIAFALVVVGSFALPILILLWNSEIILVHFVRANHTGNLVLDNGIIVLFWYLGLTGGVMFGNFVSYGICFPMSVWKWMTRIRYVNTTDTTLKNLNGICKDLHYYD